MHGAVTHAPLRLWLAQIGVGCKMQLLWNVNIPGNAVWSCLGLEFVWGIQYRQKYSYNGTIEVVRSIHNCLEYYTTSTRPRTTTGSRAGTKCVVNVTSPIIAPRDPSHPVDVPLRLPTDGRPGRVTRRCRSRHLRPLHGRPPTLSHRGNHVWWVPAVCTVWYTMLIKHNRNTAGVLRASIAARLDTSQRSQYGLPHPRAPGVAVTDYVNTSHQCKTSHLIK